MKLSLILLTVLIAAAAAQGVRKSDDKIQVEEISEPEFSLFEYGKTFDKVVVQPLKELGQIVGVNIIGKAAYILTDRLHLSPSQEVQDALQSGFSTEGVINATGELILGKAGQIAAAQAAGPSHEAILANFGPFYKLYEAEQGLSFHYDQSINPEGVSQESILGSLGGLIFDGLGNLIGGQAGDALQQAGNIIGSLFVALPGQEEVSHEGIISKLGNSGILTSSGQLVAKGAAKTARTLIKGLYKPYGDYLKNALWLYRGHYNGYSNIQEPGKEALLHARAIIHQHTEAEQCIEGAEANLTVLYDQYVENGRGCFDVGQPEGQKIIAHVFDIVLDAVKRVEDAHREVAYCFEKEVFENKVACLSEDIPAQFAEHKLKFEYYGRLLTGFVQQFTDLNTQFDVCLTGHVGQVRSDVYNLIYDFYKCVGEQVGYKRKYHF